MKTLLQINSIVNTGSTGRIVEEIGKMVLAKGWNSYIAYGRKENGSQSKLIKIGTKLDVYFHVFLSRFFDRHGLGSKKATWKLIQEMKKIKPDIVHLHNIHGYYINYLVLFDYLKNEDIPIVWTLHDCWSFTGHCSHFSFVKCNKWINYCNQCLQIREYPKALFVDNSTMNYFNKKEAFVSINRLTIISVSDWLKNLVCESFFKYKDIYIIYNGIDISVFYPMNSRKQIFYQYVLKTSYLILAVANIWTHKKGLYDLIELSKILPSSYSLIVLGLNKEQIKKLPKRIIGLERTENVNQLAQMYSASDVYINPTWEDSFPTTNLESLACGTPVVTYNTGGSIESITKETGLIVEQGDIRGLMSSIELICQQGKYKYTAACRNRVIDCFNKCDCFSSYINLYDRLLY